MSSVQGTTSVPPSQPEAQEAGTGAAGGTGDAGAGLQAIFEQAAADRERFTRIAVEGNTKIAEFNEKPKI